MIKLSHFIKSKKLKKVFLYFVLFQFVLFTLHYLSEKPIFNLLSIQHLIASDLSLNDLHYQVNQESITNSPKLSGKVFIINTGSLSKDSFRLELARVIDAVNQFSPKVIGIDHDFAADTTLIGTNELIKTVNKTKSLILARKEEPRNYLQFSKNVQYGNVTLPKDQTTVRKYSTDKSTFGYRVSLLLANQNISWNIPYKTFFIKYLTSQPGYFTKDSNEFIFYIADPNQKQKKFLMLEARDILLHDSATLNALRILSSGRAILIGHLGNSSMFNMANDIEDKQPVPLNNIISQDKTMDGVVIHANAIENIINPSNQFRAWSDSILFQIIKNIFIFLFLFYLINANLGKAVNIFSLALLSIPVVYFVLYLMTKNIYLEIGVTLLHFLIVEEFYESIESIEHLVSKYRKK